MRILHFVSGLDPASGGPSRSIPNQCIATVGEGFDVGLAFCESRRLPPQLGELAAQGIELFPLSAAQLFSRLPTLVRRCDVLHVHGLWSPSCYWALRLAGCLRRPTVIAPRGMLEPWAMSQSCLKKKVALWGGFRRLLSAATVLQATAEAEAVNLKHWGFGVPIAVIPNSVVVPRYTTSLAGEVVPKRLLFISRIHPKKGLLQLVRALCACGELMRRDAWKLIVAGPDEDGHWKLVEQEAERLRVRDLVEYVGVVDGERKWNLYRSASLFVLPTFSENFGLVVAEALACGVPCVTTHGAPWEELGLNGCGWWHPVGQEPLNAALREALGTPASCLSEMGQRGMALVHEKYGVYSHRSQLRETYRWIVNGGPSPSCLRPAARG